MKAQAGFFLVALLLTGAQDGTTANKEIAKFAGTWSVSSLIYNGEENDKLGLNITFKDDEAIIEGNEDVKREYARVKIKLDPSVTPKSVDFTIVGGVQKDTVIEGIYEWKGGELRICAKVLGKDRPQEFASPEGASTVLMVLKKTSP